MNNPVIARLAERNCQAALVLARAAAAGKPDTTPEQETYLMPQLNVFQIDDRNDRERSSDNRSRYGFYLRDRLEAFESWDDSREVTCDPVRFAVAAWRIATGPIMSPGYLTWDADRIMSVTCTRSNWDGTLYATVQLAAPRPAQLRGLYTFRDWQQGPSYAPGFYLPDESALEHGPVMTTTVEVILPVKTAHLYTPQDAPIRVSTVDAKASVRQLAALLDVQLDPILKALG